MNNDVVSMYNEATTYHRQRGSSQAFDTVKRILNYHVQYDNNDLLEAVFNHFFPPETHQELHRMTYMSVEQLQALVGEETIPELHAHYQAQAVDTVLLVPM